jgi:hypothetical protein
MRPYRFFFILLENMNLLSSIRINSLCILTVFFYHCPASAVTSHQSKVSKLREIKKKAHYLESDSFSRGAISITPYRGLITVKNYTLKEQIDTKRRLSIIIPEARIHFIPSKLMEHWDLWDSALQTTEIESEKDAKPGAPKRAKPTPKTHVFESVYNQVLFKDTLLLSCIKSISFKNVDVSIDSSGITTVRFRRMSGTVEVEHKGIPMPLMTLTAFSIEHSRMLLSRVSAVMGIQGAILNVRSFDGQWCDGQVHAVCDIDLQQKKVIAGECSIKNANLRKAYAAKKFHQGTLTGKLGAVITIKDSPLLLDKAKGTVQVTMNTIRFTNVPLITQVSSLTRQVGVKKIRFDSLTGTFVIKAGKIRTENLFATGDVLTIWTNGSINLKSGYFYFWVKGRIPAYFSKHASAVAWNTLTPQKNGDRTFTCTMQGTEAEPVVEFDKKLAKRAIRSLFGELGKRIKALFH